MRYAVITAILALGLAGCQGDGTLTLDGIKYNCEGSGSGSSGDVVCNSDKPVNDNDNINIATPDPGSNNEQIVETPHYYQSFTSIHTSSDYRGFFDHYFLPDIDDQDYYQKLRKWMLDVDKQYASTKRKVEVDGELGLFIEFNTGREWKQNLGTIYKRDFYIVSGGNLSNAGPWDDVDWLKNWYMNVDGMEYKYDSYSPMPNGVYGYNGKVVMARTRDFNGFDVGTVEAEVDFNNNSMWIEFEGVGIGHRFDDFEYLDFETGYFEDELPFRQRQYGSVYGYLIGQEAKGMEGNVQWEDSSNSKNNYRAGVFVAERSGTPTVAE